MLFNQIFLFYIDHQIRKITSLLFIGLIYTLYITKNDFKFFEKNINTLKINNFFILCMSINILIFKILLNKIYII